MMGIFEDGHSNEEIPCSIPNQEVKLATSAVVVSVKRQNSDAVFFIFFRNIIFTIIYYIITFKTAFYL